MLKYRSSRRNFLLGGAAVIAGCTSVQRPAEEIDWRPFFPDLNRGGILVNLEARRLAYWGPNNSVYREYPVGVPSAPQFERRGRTRIVRKRAGPSWSPTPAMRRRNPSLPSYMPPGPDNPLGAYALYLGWQYYAIHGTNDPVTIGRRSTSGCIRLFDRHIEWMYRNVSVGTPVLIV